MKITSILSALFLFMAVVFTAHAQNSQTRTPGTFTRVETGGSWDVFITKGNKDEVRLESASFDLNKVITELDGRTLKIKLEKGNYRNVELQVYVTVRELEAVGCSGSGNVLLASDFGADEFSIGTSGSGTIKAKSINARNLNVGMSGSGDVEIEGGQVDYVTIGQSGSGDFEGIDLNAQTVKIGKSGSGQTHITAIKSLTVGASGSGNVYYRGNPEMQKVGISGSAKLVRQ
uniref:head GIN domain-containing protein n=1 Tax=Algoriphagus sp. TaxID=1872435 RepID=UPI0025884355|nr:head GIN domain-containing protein [Algoriphagus sp.]